MTDDKKKNDDKDREKVSDEEMEDVAGGSRPIIGLKHKGGRSSTSSRDGTENHEIRDPGIA